jgi:hypothetical protein
MNEHLSFVKLGTNTNDRFCNDLEAYEDKTWKGGVFLSGIDGSK